MAKYPNITALTVHGHFIYDGKGEKVKVEHPMMLRQVVDAIDKTGPRPMAVFIDDRVIHPKLQTKKIRRTTDELLLQLIGYYINSTDYVPLEIFFRAPAPKITCGFVRDHDARYSFANLTSAVPGHEHFYRHAGKLGIEGGLVIGGERRLGITAKVFDPAKDVLTPLDMNNLFPMSSIRAEFIRDDGTVFDDPNVEKEIKGVRYYIYGKDGGEWVFEKPYVQIPFDMINPVIDQIPLSKVTVASTPKASMGPMTVMMALPFGSVPEGALFQTLLDGLTL